MARIYLASSWRNKLQPALVATLRGAGHQVYDFRNPPHGRGGFAWEAVDTGWRGWTARGYRNALKSPIAQAGFKSDKDGMDWADVCVLLLPCGRSAHLEAGYMAGQGKRVIVFTHDGEEPELMALLLSQIVCDEAELLAALGPVGSCADCDHWAGRKAKWISRGSLVGEARFLCSAAGSPDCTRHYDTCGAFFSSEGLNDEA